MAKKVLSSDKKDLIGGLGSYKLYYDPNLNTIGVSDGEKMFKVDLERLGKSLFEEENDEARQ